MFVYFSFSPANVFHQTSVSRYVLAGGYKRCVHTVLHFSLPAFTAVRLSCYGLRQGERQGTHPSLRRLLHLFYTFTLKLTDILLLLIAISSWGPCHLGHVPHNVGGGWQSTALRGLWICSPGTHRLWHTNRLGTLHQPWRAGSWSTCSSIDPLRELLLDTPLRAFGQSCSALFRLFLAILQPILTSSSILNLQKDKTVAE